MSRIKFSNFFNFSTNNIYSWHLRSGAVERLLPPWLKIRISPPFQKVDEDHKTQLLCKWGLWKIKATFKPIKILENKAVECAQIQGPLKQWVHSRNFFPKKEISCTVEDQIEFQLPWGFFGKCLEPFFVKKLKRLFFFRTQRLLYDLHRHQTFQKFTPKKIALSGASGLVGGNLRAFLLSGGHEIFPLVRRGPKSGTQEIFWDPEANEIDSQSLEGIDAVIHLAGDNIASGRWTKRKKETIYQSRVHSTKFLTQALSKLNRPPKVLLGASAIGFYGDRKEETLTESSTSGSSFLTSTCQAWEEAYTPAVLAGIRVIKFRIGMILSTQGGALQKMLGAFRCGLGGTLSKGQQYMSWISLEDVLGVFLQGIYQEKMEGPINLVSPNPVTNREFTKTLGKLLRRPTLFSVPALAIKFFYGEMGRELLLGSSKVFPTKLEELSFSFLHPTLEEALRFQLGINSLQPITPS